MHPNNHEKFDHQTPITLTGTVKEVDWNDPHVVVHIAAKEKGGQTKDWRVEMGSLDEMENQGWTDSTIKPGDRITVEGNPAKSEPNFAIARMIELAGGKRMSTTSERGRH